MEEQATDVVLDGAVRCDRTIDSAVITRTGEAHITVVARVRRDGLQPHVSTLVKVVVEFDGEPLGQHFGQRDTKIAAPVGSEIPSSLPLASVTATAFPAALAFLMHAASLTTHFTAFVALLSAVSMAVLASCCTFAFTFCLTNPGIWAPVAVGARAASTSPSVCPTVIMRAFLDPIGSSSTRYASFLRP